MKKIIAARRKGKTTLLIKQSAETGEYIVCPTMQEAGEIQKMAMKMGLSIPLPISYQEFLTGRYAGHNIKGFLIENAEELLQSLSPIVPITAITMSFDKNTLIREEKDEAFDFSETPVSSPADMFTIFETGSLRGPEGPVKGQFLDGARVVVKASALATNKDFLSAIEFLQERIAE